MDATFIKKVLDDFHSKITVREDGNRIFIIPPIFHLYNDESIAFKIKKEDEGILFSDCGTTCDYLELNYISLTKYQSRLNAIMERFGLTYEDGEFFMFSQATSGNQIRRELTIFFEAISIIANIDI